MIYVASKSKTTNFNEDIKVTQLMFVYDYIRKHDPVLLNIVTNAKGTPLILITGDINDQYVVDLRDYPKSAVIDVLGDVLKTKRIISFNPKVPEILMASYGIYPRGFFLDAYRKQDNFADNFELRNMYVEDFCEHLINTSDNTDFHNDVELVSAMIRTTGWNYNHGVIEQFKAMVNEHIAKIRQENQIIVKKQTIFGEEEEYGFDPTKLPETQANEYNQCNASLLWLEYATIDYAKHRIHNPTMPPHLLRQALEATKHHEYVWGDYKAFMAYIIAYKNDDQQLIEQLEKGVYDKVEFWIEHFKEQDWETARYIMDIACLKVYKKQIGKIICANTDCILVEVQMDKLKKAKAELAVAMEQAFYEVLGKYGNVVIKSGKFLT